jgi:hypothetical protein
MVAGHVHEHMHTATNSKLRMTLMVNIGLNLLVAMLRRAGAVVVPGSDGPQFDPDTMCHHHIFHPNTVHTRFPVVEAHW